MATVYRDAESGEWQYTTDGDDGERPGLIREEYEGTCQKWLDEQDKTEGAVER